MPTRFNTEKLEARIVEKFGSQKKFCAEIGLAQSTLSRYLSEGCDWKGSILVKAIRALAIPEDQIDDYFFQPKVPKRELKGVKK
jgi:transcriptional regulator with XRE-family HTH domain